MLNQDYTAKLLNMEDVIITNVENISDQVHIYLGLSFYYRTSNLFDSLHAPHSLNRRKVEDRAVAGGFDFVPVANCTNDANQ